MNPFARMFFRRMSFGDWLVFIGAVVLVLGLVLLLVQLVIALSYMAGVITLTGLVVLGAGLVLRRRKGRRREIDDEIPYL